MKKSNLFFIIFLIILSSCEDNNPNPTTPPTASNLNIQWQKCLGGTNSDDGAVIEQTFDGGYIVCGTSNSIDLDVLGNHGDFDYCVFKLNTIGGIEWQKCYGGSGADGRGVLIHRILQTSDGGFVLVGYTKSNDGDIIGNHGEADGLIIKLDNNGNIQWQKCLGGTLDDGLCQISQMLNGNYLVVGSTNSTDGDLSGINYHGNGDGWIIMLDGVGNIINQKCFGGSASDVLITIQNTIDGGFILGGNTFSVDGDVVSGNGDGEGWVLKIDTIFNIQWQKCLGGSGDDDGVYVIPTSDGGYLAYGSTNSNDRTVNGNHGDYDVWATKLYGNGSIQWSKCYGGSNEEGVFSATEYSNGNYILAGFTSSNDGNVSGNHSIGQYDSWVLKINGSGTIISQKCLGGSDHDVAKSIDKTTDGGFILGGRTYSQNGDVLGLRGDSDFWVVKLN